MPRAGEVDAQKCEDCHVAWTTITTPHVVMEELRSRNGIPILVTRYTGGLGQTPLDHLWQHAEANK